jgi:TctA family transporter
MAFEMLNAAGDALLIIMDPHRLMFLSLGVVFGLVLGILPGIGGLAGTVMLLPFTFSMDPYTAFAFLLGLGATTATGDPIPAILFGVPGGSASAATVLDGLPMARRGEAGRALSAAYMSSMLGGVFGAALMAIAIPVLRPLMLSFGSPEMLALSVFGISTVAVLSGRTPLRGVTAAGLGLMVAMVGADPQTGTLRWTLDTLYLWEGVQLLPLVLGVFALPELCDLLITRTSIASEMKYSIKTGMWRGAVDCYRNMWLIVRCSWIGAVMGAVPGMSGSIIDWLAYGHAVRTEKGAKETFGKGDVRGVIASESSNNAREGGALVPTVAFGIPGSAGMAVLLGAFLIHGLIPGPDMLTKNLKFTYSMVWSVAIANILGAGMCYLFSGQFARLATLRYTLILPTVLAIIYIGAFEATRSWGDLYSLLLFGVLGWTMKQLRWPRPPFILGFVLGAMLERYLFISIERYGTDWLIPKLGIDWTSVWGTMLPMPTFEGRIAVLILFGMAALSLLRPLIQNFRGSGGLGGIVRSYGRPHIGVQEVFTLVIILWLGAMLYEASEWNFKASIVPNIVGGIAIGFATLALLHNAFGRRKLEAAAGTAEAAKAEVSQAIHMDLASDTGHLPAKTVALRGTIFFGWLVAFMASMATIGLIPTVPLFVTAFMRIEGRERWRLVLPNAIVLTLFIYVVFDQLLTIPWPPTLIEYIFPQLKGLVPSI